jgi:hypothetical protein
VTAQKACAAGYKDSFLGVVVFHVALITINGRSHTSPWPADSLPFKNRGKVLQTVNLATISKPNLNNR